MRDVGFVWFVFLFVLGSIFVSPVWANHEGGHSSTSIPASATAGAVWSHVNHNMYIERNDDTLFGPQLDQPQEPVLSIQPGVLPARQNVQSILTTPDGQTIVGPRE